MPRMPSARARKPANTQPTALARPITTSATTPITLDPELQAYNNEVIAVTTATQPEPEPEPELEVEAEPDLEVDDTVEVATLLLKPKRFKFTEIIEAALFHELLEQANSRKRADNSFKKEAWITTVKAVSMSAGYIVTVEQCKGKVDTIKALWKDYK
jgi:hypothetical protein